MDHYSKSCGNLFKLQMKFWAIKSKSVERFNQSAVPECTNWYHHLQCRFASRANINDP